MKEKFSINIVNKTGKELRILPGERRILPRAHEILEHLFSKPLRIRLGQSDDTDTDTDLKPYTAAITSIYNYGIRFKRREEVLEWKLAVKKFKNGTGSVSQENSMVICSIQGEGGGDDKTVNVPINGEEPG